MRVSRVRRALLCASVSACALLAGAGAASAAELPLARVVLSSSGLAQFTHAGRVSGDTAVTLPVRLDQVDDILKSLTVFDTAGTVGAVSLPGKTPLPELFRDLPFGPDALNSSADLLNALVGSEVEIGGPVTAKGRVFRVQREEVALPNNGGTTFRHRLTLMTAGGLVQAILEDVTELRFTDPGTRQQIERLLAGLTENRAKDRRVVSVGFRGGGSRDVAVSYVVAAPVWKTAYRLVLPKDGGRARLQGWAVVENLTGGDWTDIELTLVSGDPVALRQPLYTALFAARPEVPVSTGTRIVPRRDDVQERAAPTARREDGARFATAPQAANRQVAAAPAAPVSEAPLLPAGAANAATAGEATTQLLYRFPAKVSLATGHTMMLPFIDRELPATRTWLYQPDVVATRPLAAVRLQNDGDAGLPAGLVTTYESTAEGGANFVGDALLPLMPKGASRFITFALDSRTAIRREDKGIVRTTLGKALNGTLTMQRRSRRTINYEVSAPPDEDRSIVVEEARAAGWTPVQSKDVEETPTRFRHTIAAPRGVTTRASFALERLDHETVVLTDLDAQEMLASIRGLQNESPALKETVAKLAALVEEIAKAKAQRSELDGERSKIVADQARLRANLQSVGQTSDLGRRYLATLRNQEDRLAEIARLDGEREKDVRAKQQAAEALVRQLTL